MEIFLSAEKIGSIGSLPITNSLLTTWLVMTLLTIIVFVSTKKLSLVPSGAQNFAESVVEFLYGNVSALAGDKKAKVFFPIVATFFIFIIFSNWLGLFPGFGTIGFNEHHDGKEVFVPLLRSANSDLNTTLAFSLISVLTTHFFAVKYLGIFGWIKKYFSFNPVYLFVGILEIVAEITKVISLSFRLFGNIFAGEALLIQISTLAAFILPLPFLLMELLVGFVQATIFAMLTLVFLVVLTEDATH